MWMSVGVGGLMIMRAAMEVGGIVDAENQCDGDGEVLDVRGRRQGVICQMAMMMARYDMCDDEDDV